MARNQDVPDTIPLAESAGNENKVIIPEQKGDTLLEIQKISKRNLKKMHLQMKLKRNRKRLRFLNNNYCLI